MQLVELHRLGRRGEPLESQSMEVLGPAAGPFEDAVDGAWIDVADVGGRLDGAAVCEALLARAADRVADSLYPDRATDFDAILARALAAIPDGLAKSHGLALGR